MFCSADGRHKRFWRVGIARNAVSFHSFVASRARKVSSEKRGGAAEDVDKICTTPARESNFCEKKAPSCVVGALLEVELRKNLRRACARERFGS